MECQIRLYDSNPKQFVVAKESQAQVFEEFSANNRIRDIPARMNVFKRMERLRVLWIDEVEAISF